MPRRALACSGDTGLLRVRRRAPGCPAAGAPRAENARRAHDTRGLRPVHEASADLYAPAGAAHASYLPGPALTGFRGAPSTVACHPRPRPSPPPGARHIATSAAGSHQHSRTTKAWGVHVLLRSYSRRAGVLKFDARKKKDDELVCFSSISLFSFLFWTTHAEVRSKVG